MLVKPERFQARDLDFWCEQKTAAAAKTLHRYAIILPLSRMQHSEPRTGQSPRSPHRTRGGCGGSARCGNRNPGSRAQSAQEAKAVEEAIPAATATRRDCRQDRSPRAPEDRRRRDGSGISSLWSRWFHRQRKRNRKKCQARKRRTSDTEASAVVLEKLLKREGRIEPARAWRGCWRILRKTRWR